MINSHSDILKVKKLVRSPYSLSLFGFDSLGFGDQTLSWDFDSGLSIREAFKKRGYLMTSIIYVGGGQKKNQIS